MEKLRRAIRTAMKRRGESPEEFHRQAKIGRSTLFALLDEHHAANPELSTLRKLRAVGVRIPRDLLTG